MPLNLPSAVVQKIMKLKSIKYDNGKCLLWGIPAVFSPNYVKVYDQGLMEKQFGVGKAMEFNHAIGKLQGIQGTKFIVDRFGYAETIKDKQKLLEFISGQTEMVGIGKFEWVRMDFKSNHFIIKGTSPFAEEYQRFFGQQKAPVDYFLRGLFCGGIEAFVKEKLLCVETQCMSQGKKECEFVIKPIKDWDMKDPKVKAQLVKDLADFKKLGSKKEPYVILGK
ncbi:MAG: 4-vinyl reductase [Candidatus Woesearchaeota archaeon]